MRKSAVYTNSAHELMKVVVKEISGVSENHCEILFNITNHVLLIISHKVSKEHGDGVIVQLEDIDENDRPSKVVDEIGHWLLQKPVVGHVMFGGAQFKKFEEEVNVSDCFQTLIIKHYCKLVCAGMESIIQKIHLS